MQSTASISGLPGLARHEGRELALLGPDLGRDPAQVVSLLHARHPPPGGLGPRGRLHRRGDVLVSAIRHQPHEVERGGIPDLAGGGPAGGHPRAVDEDGGDVGHTAAFRWKRGSAEAGSAQ